MNEEQLKAFIAVLDTGSFSAAASQINLSQPAISQRIKGLEQRLGCPLFERSPGRSAPILTEAGHLLEAEARATLSRWGDLEHILHERETLRSGSVTLGGGATAVSVILPKVIAQILDKYPDLNIRVRESGSSEVVKRVLQGEVDIGIVTNSGEPFNSTLQTYHLRDDKIVPVVTPRHPLADHRGELLPQELNGQRLVAYESTSAIGQVISRSLAKHQVKARVWTELRSIHSILEIAQLTMSIALVPEMSKSLWGEMISLSCPALEAEMSRSLYAVMRRDVLPTRAVSEFLSLIL